MQNVEWVVLSGERLQELSEPVYFCVVPRGYEGLSYNMAEILRYVTEADSQLKYYRDEQDDGE